MKEGHLGEHVLANRFQGGKDKTIRDHEKFLHEITLQGNFARVEKLENEAKDFGADILNRERGGGRVPHPRREESAKVRRATEEETAMRVESLGGHVNGDV